MVEGGGEENFLYTFKLSLRGRWHLMRELHNERSLMEELIKHAYHLRNVLLSHEGEQYE